MTGLKEPIHVFEDEIKTLQDQVANANFSACILIADTHTRYFILADDGDLTFISEMFNDIFRDFAHLATEYQVEKDALSETNKSINGTLGQILENFKKHDEAGLYGSLRNLRLIASKLQLEYWQSKTPSHATLRISQFGER